MLYSCRKGCFADRPFDCIHGSRAKAVEPDLKGGDVFYVDENQLRSLVIAGIREAMPSHSKPDQYSQIREWGEVEERARTNAKKQELAWRVLAQVRGNNIIQREIDMELCPCPPPAIAVDLGYAVPSHIRYWPI